MKNSLFSYRSRTNKDINLYIISNYITFFIRVLFDNINKIIKYMFSKKNL